MKLHTKLGALSAASLMLMGLALQGCEEEDGDGPSTANDGMAAYTDEFVPPARPVCTINVSPDNENDQQALRQALIEQAEEGDVVCLEAGTFEFTSQLDVDINGITLQGASQEETTLSFAEAGAGASRGIYITGNDVTVRDFRIENTPGDAIEANTVDNIAMIDLTVWWDCDECTENGAYGVYPVKASGVLVHGCTVKGAADAGVYVGQSKWVRVSNNIVFGNVAGIEIENTVDSEVVNNDVYDNTGGILLFNLPGPEIQGGERSLVHYNDVYENNTRNFAEPGTVVADVPAGTGVMIVATSNNEVRDNLIEDNVSFAVLIVNYLDLLGEDWQNNEEFSRISQGNVVISNSLSNNGRDIQGFSGLIATILGISGNEEDPMPDVVYDGCHIDPEYGLEGEFAPNCAADNTPAATYANFDYCGDPKGVNAVFESPAPCAPLDLPEQDGVRPDM